MKEDVKVISVLYLYVNVFVYGNPTPSYLFKRVTILKKWLTHSREGGSQTFDVQYQGVIRLAIE